MFHKYGTIIKAIPAGTFDEPTPKFLITVGNSSAVNTGMTTFDEDIENFPIIANVIVSHSQVLPFTLLPVKFNTELM